MAIKIEDFSENSSSPSVCMIAHAERTIHKSNVVWVSRVTENVWTCGRLFSFAARLHSHRVESARTKNFCRKNLFSILDFSCRWSLRVRWRSFGTARGKTKKKSSKEETTFVRILFYVIKLIGGKYVIFVRCQRKSREKPNLSGTSWKSRMRRVVNESKYCENVPLDSHFPPNRKLKARSKKKILIFSLLGAIKSEKNLIQTHTRASRREK